MHKILWIDQSSKKLWFAYFEDDLIESGHDEITNSDFYTSFKSMLEWTGEKLDQYKPEIVFTEDPMSLARVNPAIARKLMFTLSAMVYACWNRDIQLEILAPSQIKKVFTGKWNAKKDVVRAMVLEKYNIDTKSEDEADAIAIWYTWTKIIE